MFNRLSIQSRLLLILLLVSIGSMLSIAFLSVNQAERALRRAVFQRLIGQRNSRARQVTDYLDSVRNLVITFSNERTAQSAMKECLAAYREMGAKPAPPALDARLRSFYSDTFFPALKARVDGELQLEQYVPRSTAARRLQYLYLATNPFPYGKKEELDAAADGSRYSAIHGRVQPFVRDLVHRFGYEDILLIDPMTGDIVYTEQKNTDFGTNLENGPYAESNLGDLYRIARRISDKYAYRLVDFAFYRPNLEAPAGFVCSTVLDGQDLIGLMVFEFPLEPLNRIMCSDYEWQQDGLGRTGETYLIGPDAKLRTDSRFYHQDPGGTLKALREAGAPLQEVDAIRRMGTATLNLTVRNAAAQRALTGKTGYDLLTDYRGRQILAAYAPLDMNNLRWGIIAKIDADEAFAPIRDYTRKVLLTAAALVLAVSILSLLLASNFLRPITRLIEAARRVAAGETDLQVSVQGPRELAELSEAFNEMNRSLQNQRQVIEQKSEENEALLLNILPGPVAARVKEGERNVAETFSDVTILYAQVNGLPAGQEDAPSRQAVALFNDLVTVLDDAADRFAIEKVKTVGQSYMAVCGLSVQRPDHTNRAVEFAAEMTRIVSLFNLERQICLNIWIGISTGPVVGGVVGRHKFIYDLWGDTVDVARGIRPREGPSAVRVTETVADRLRGQHEFESVGSVEVPGRDPIAVWQLRLA
jgi:class 3 adenylate cyclase